MNTKFKLTARKFSIYTILCGVLLLYACRKELANTNELSAATNGITLEQAKNYYAALVKKEGDELKLEKVIGNKTLST